MENRRQDDMLRVDGFGPSAGSEDAEDAMLLTGLRDCAADELEAWLENAHLLALAGGADEVQVARLVEEHGVRAGRLCVCAFLYVEGRDAMDGGAEAALLYNEVGLRLGYGRGHGWLETAWELAYGLSHGGVFVSFASHLTLCERRASWAPFLPPELGIEELANLGHQLVYWTHRRFEGATTSELIASHYLCNALRRATELHGSQVAGGDDEMV